MIVTVSTNSRFPSKALEFPSTALESADALGGLFPEGVVIRSRRAPGDAADLLPAEALHVRSAQPKRIQEFAAGRMCARSALAEFGVRDFALHPASDRQPVWPEGFVGSITHTSGWCAAVVAPRTHMLALGLDTEVVGAATLDIWPTICREEELAWVLTLPAVEQPAAVTFLFAAKEAFYKCQYPLVGEWLDFHDLKVESDEWGESAGAFRVSATRDTRFARWAALPLSGRHLFHDRYVSAAVSVAAAAPSSR